MTKCSERVKMCVHAYSDKRQIHRYSIGKFSDMLEADSSRHYRVKRTGSMKNHIDHMEFINTMFFVCFFLEML